MRYFRNRAGTIVHAEHCDRMGTHAVLWEWAEHRRRATIEDAMFRHGIRACTFCCGLVARPIHLKLVSGDD